MRAGTQCRKYLSFCRLTALTVLGPSMTPVPIAASLRNDSIAMS